MVVVRRIRADEADALRHVRFAALTESPEAFAVKLEDEAARPRCEWEQWAADGASGGETATFVAVAGDAFVGLAAGFRHRTMPVAAHLVAMWVVVENTPARTLYRDLGFRPTGDAQPLPSEPDLIEERWELPLR